MGEPQKDRLFKEVQKNITNKKKKKYTIAIQRIIPFPTTRFPQERILDTTAHKYHPTQILIGERFSFQIIQISTPSLGIETLSFSQFLDCFFSLSLPLKTLFFDLALSISIWPPKNIASTRQVVVEPGPPSLD